jgi:hypothetical protein
MAILHNAGRLAQEAIPAGAKFVASMLVPGPDELLIGAAAIFVTARAGKVLKLIDGMEMRTDEALDAAEDFLGPGYREAASGRFESADGMRQVRMQDGDILSPSGAHMNFEVKRPKSDKPGRNRHKSIHIFLKDQ